MRRVNITDEYLTFLSITNAGMLCGISSSYHKKVYRLVFNWCLDYYMSLYHEICMMGFEVFKE